jgi:hypothetical protein
LSANAAIYDPDVEVAFDNTVGIPERDYFQNYIPPERLIPHISRPVNIEATVALLRAVDLHVDAVRLRRCANHYRLALEHWRLGRETLSLAHLWMALEALTKAKIRSECVVRGLVEPRDLATSLGVELPMLDATVRKDLILKGDEECYRQASRASDGLEHGYLDFGKIRDLSTNVRQRMAGYVRSAIFDILGIQDDTLQLLTSDPYNKPIGYWPVAKYVRGKLVGSGDELAAKGNAYPFMRWRPSIKAANVDETGEIHLQMEETVTAELADGISFQPQSIEVWQPG